MTKRMLADVLWEAANLHLREVYDGHDRNHNYKRDAFSCNAVGLSLGKGRHYVFNIGVSTFLESLGCNGSPRQIASISQMTNGMPELQGVRYMWLLLAMHVAEDEGIEA